MLSKPFLTALFLLFVLVSQSQNTGVGINANAAAPDSSAMLDVSSNVKGVLISRMSTEERLAIKKPAMGLMVYDITYKCLCIFSGSYWQFMCDDVNINDGLIAYFKFSSNMADSSGNNLQATVYGEPAYDTDKSGKFNSALTFDGQHDYLLVNDNGLANVPSISISLWYKTKVIRSQQILSRVNYSNVTNFSWVVAAGSTANPPNDYYANFLTVAPYACGTVPSINIASDVLYTNQTVNVNEWYHLVCTFGNGFQKIYVNGKLKGSVKRNFNTLPMCTPSQLVFGAWWANDPQFFAGTMDEVRIYGRVLNEKEIEQLFVKQ